MNGSQRPEGRKICVHNVVLLVPGPSGSAFTRQEA